MVTVEEFWQWVDRKGSSECWLWKGRMDGNGYGTAYFSRKSEHSELRGLMTAHRAAWILTQKRVSECHSIDVFTCPENKHCCNPEHLTAGSKRDCHTRMKAAMKGSPSYVCHDGGRFRSLSDDQVRAFRAQYAASEHKYGFIQRVADRAGIHRNTVARAIKGQGSYRNVR